MSREEDKELVRLFSEQGMSIKSIVEETGIMRSTILYWRSKWGLPNTRNKCDYTGSTEEVQQRLIKIMREAPEVSYTIFNSKESSTPPATTYRKYFGSWEAALLAAGLTLPKCSMKADRLTTVYLVRFIDGDFYKIGVTQQSVDSRLGGRYPKYEKILELKTSLKEAKVIEREWLDTVKPFKFVPTSFPVEGRGFTECFKYT